jgi:hypothetical protein
MGVPLGVTPFTTPGVSALDYQFPPTVNRARNEYYPFESQIPSYQGGNMQANQYNNPMMQGQWGQPQSSAQAPPPQPFSKYNQYAAASGAYPMATYPSPVMGTNAFASGNLLASRPSPMPGKGGFTSGDFPMVSRPSPVPAGLGGFTSGGFPATSGPSPALATTPSASAGGYSQMAASSSNSALYNPYAPPSQAPNVPSTSGTSSRSYVPDDEWVNRMHNLNLAINKPNTSRK